MAEICTVNMLNLIIVKPPERAYSDRQSIRKSGTAGDDTRIIHSPFIRIPDRLLLLHISITA